MIFKKQKFRSLIKGFVLYFGFTSLSFSEGLFAMHHWREIPGRLNIFYMRRTITMNTMPSAAFDYPKQQDTAPKILHYGNPILYKKSLPFDLPREMPLVHNALEQMTLATKGLGNVGLAAPQIGILRRLVMFEVPATHPRYKTDGIAQPMRIMINPSYKPLSNEKNLEWEGCLSVPGMMGKVWRYTHIEYEYTDLEGKMHTLNASHFYARVVQHELDHLDGILFPLLVENRHDLGFTEEIMASQQLQNQENNNG